MTNLRLSVTGPSTTSPDTTSPTASHRDVVVKVSPDTTVAEVAAALDLPSQAFADAPGLLVSESSLRSGAILTDRPSGHRAPSPAHPQTGTGSEGIRLEAVSGPFAGETVLIVPSLIPASGWRIGNADTADLRLNEPFVHAQHATVLPSHHVTARLGDEKGAPVLLVLRPDASEQWPVIVNGQTITEPTAISNEDFFQIGSTIFRLGTVPVADADIHPDGAGFLAFNRASRILPPRTEPVLWLPGDKPASTDRTPMPWIAAIVPVVMAVVLAMVMQRPTMLIMAAASPVMVVGSYLTSQRLAKSRGRRTTTSWRVEAKAAAEQLATITTSQRQAAWHLASNPVKAIDTATLPTARLWERRPSDADAATVRIGVGQQPLHARIENNSAKDESPKPTMSPTPITVDLSQGVLGLAGPAPATASLARSILIETATARSPRESRIVVLCDNRASDQWEWVRWLPHTDGDDSAHTLIGNSDDTRIARLAWLKAVIDTRAALTHTGRNVVFEEHLFVLIDGAQQWRTLPGMIDLLARGPGCGVFVIATDTNPSRLPEETVSVLTIDADDPTMGSLASASQPCPEVLLDALPLPLARTAARSLTPIVHTGGIGDDAATPSSVRLVSLLGIDLDNPAQLLHRWESAPRTTRAIIGADAQGPVAIDLATDGPHGLIAGTTGSGKSAFLQTLVSSLALANRPDALNFLLIDYKGGGAFAQCASLPHTVGMVTNLDGRETQRALASLDAELKRRQTVLADLGVEDAKEAWARDPQTAAARGLARLVLVIDEFAELKLELPDLITGLLRIARVGRSLGVHLLLATQKPSGTITPEMQSNTNLRVSLRVTDKSNSMDVIDAPDAANISSSTPGRGYIRRGAGQAPAIFQSGMVAGRRPGTASALRLLPQVVPVRWDQLGEPVRFPPHTSSSVSTTQDRDDTDLRAIVELVGQAATELGITRNPAPWLAPLPTQLTLADLPNTPEPAHKQDPGLDIILGLEDVPSQQAQRPLNWSITHGSHLMFIGGARSGRTTALRGIVGQIATCEATNVHLYAIDYGNGGLRPAADLPHCGAVVTPLESGRLQRFMTRLLADLATRQNTLAQAGVGDINEQRRLNHPGSPALPFALVLIDGYERVSSDLGIEALAVFKDQLMKLLREGPAAGIRIILAGDRAVLTDKIAGFIDTKYLLPMTDRDDYRLVGIAARELPEHIPAGRIYFGTQPTREAQLAILDAPADGAAQHAALEATVETATRRHHSLGTTTGPRPFRVDVLPASISYAHALNLPVAEPSMSTTGPMIGVGGDELTRYHLDWAITPGFVIAGERGSGRSTALATLVHGFADLTRPVIVIDHRASILTDTARSHGTPVINPASPDAAADLTHYLQTTAPTHRIAVIIDNAETLTDGTLTTALAAANNIDYIVGCQIDDAANTFKGPIAEAKKHRQGLFLWPTSGLSGTQILSLTIPKHHLGRNIPGRAILLSNGEYTSIQVPTP
ncbi:S-DNA-T family DNA segregation ATPase FtsK/SpoIIIE [Psychromicrobium silvestre]|uniref:S-DNA-T family DNA segregation ATPase FtsK/SpoIIIE n=1 Tax=Psychromicrobium silvestre TaxID=1645614 RepID=A0A7Y9S779_9MICC|nr:FtsK/SpoIIIE domain-containing protein [Psychromicrobium silvestre]NYE94492.1 S-DNA-T family DNA segregation ATPase FtsK/SpoIIIE [Psychromicrobium silvestre]